MYTIAVSLIPLAVLDNIHCACMEQPGDNRDRAGKHAYLGQLGLSSPPYFHESFLSDFADFIVKQLMSRKRQMLSITRQAQLP